MYNRRGTVDRSLLFEQFYPLVRRLAYQIGQRLPPNVEIDDLIQVGTIGLMQAIEKYTPAEGDHFEAYAASRIRGAIMDELREQDTMSRSLRKVQRQIEQATQLLEHELGRKPTLAECAKALEMSLDEYQEAITAINSGQVMFIEALPERERMTLSLYYEHDMTLREIGAVLGVNESRVSQIHSAVLKTLRENIREWTQAQEILSR